MADAMIDFVSETDQSQETQSGFESEFDDQHLSPRSYARHHRLVEDYAHENPFHLQCLPSPPESLLSDLVDPSSTVNVEAIVDLSALEDHTAHERWEVDKASVEFIASVVALGREGDALCNQGSEGMLYIKDLKLVEPVLASDPQLDIIQLKRRNSAVISVKGMEPFELDTENDESIFWSSKYRHLPIEKDETLARERLDVDPETMEYLKEIWNSASVNKDDTTQSAYGYSESQGLEDLSQYVRKHALRPVTPPLLPLSPPISPAGLSPTVAELELTSTPEDLIAREAADLERHIMGQDDAPSQDSAQSLSKRGPEIDYSPLYTPVESSSSPSCRKRLQDLRADVPLIPRDIDESPAKKAKTMYLSDTVHLMLPQPESDNTVMSAQDMKQDPDASIEEALEPLARAAIQRTENEQLAAFDTIMRVPVPAIYDVEITAPWRTFAATSTGSLLAAQKTLLSRTKNELLSGELTWGGTSKIERTLPWKPFAVKLGKVDTVESFDDGSLARYMAGMSFEDSIDTQSLTWKADGLRVLEDDSDEDELEPLTLDGDEDDGADAQPEPAPADSAATMHVSPTFQKSSENERSVAEEPVVPESGRMDMQSLLRKRKMELESANETAVARSLGNDISVNCANGNLSAKPASIQHLTEAGGLSSFMNLHGAPAQRTNPIPAQSAALPHSQLPSAILSRSIPAEITMPAEQSRPLPAPQPHALAKSTSILISSKMLQNRQLTRQVKSMLQGVEMIERDSDLRSSNKDHEPNTGSDADYTLSPSTGILVTTLQKVKQKPLPGQNTFFGVRERIASVALQYERLIVLLNEGQQPTDTDGVSTTPLDERDAEAMSDLTGFAASIDAEVNIYYVGGGETELARWLSAIIAHNALSDEDITLLQDETVWERFLRSAGLNPFAAQAILAAMKLPEYSPGSGDSGTLGGSNTALYGLPVFVKMSTGQRVERFGPLMGGEKVLRRVSKVIDTEWASASSKVTGQ